MDQKEIDKINAELKLISEEEKERIKKVCGEDFTYWDIPTYIRKRNEGIKEEIEKDRAFSLLAEEYYQEELERKEREKIENGEIN